MEHIIISPGKLKLMLTKSDLSKYELDCNTLDSEDMKTRRAFRELLSDAGRLSGFDTSDDKLYIQLYPSKDGGAEIYITKLTFRREPANGERITVNYVYRFDTVDDLITLCARASKLSEESASSAWYGDGAYFLIISKEQSEKRYPSANQASGAIFASYGVPLGTSQATAAYVREHCSCICKNDALAKLARLA